MGRFRDLQHVKDHLPPGDQQLLRSELLPSVVANTRMSMWSPGESFPATGARILIGVVTWSLYDLDLLDTLDQSTFDHDTVHVFDLDSCATQSDIENYIPGIGKVCQTPVLGYWQDGQQLHREQGAAARDWLRNRYTLPPQVFM